MKILDEVNKGVKRKKDIAEDFGIPPSTLSTIIKHENKIYNAAQESPSSKKKRMKVSSFPELEEAMVKWINRARDNHVPISGPLIQEKALEFAEELGIEGFKGSTGWLKTFKSRNGIIEKIISGESASVSEVDCEFYQTNVLRKLLNEYDSNDVYNLDEFGLFFKCLPDRTLTFIGDTCHGGKKSKERLTVMVGANMTGSDKLKLLVIGKSAKPRCFKNIDISSLPVKYSNNKTAWMTSEIYESWLHEFDRKFQKQNRKVLFFLDNCPAHPKILSQQLKAIHVVFFPPNMTSKLQPMDQGVIKNIKHLYRKKMMQRTLRSLDSGKKRNDIDVLESITLLHQSWHDVKQSTIINCFKKAGFIQGNSNVND